MKRRSFLLTIPAAAALSASPISSKTEKESLTSDRLGKLLPLRKLGSTGEKVTLLGTGGFHVGWAEEKDAIEVIETSIEEGIRFFDTAESYQQGESERRYGKYLVPNYRDDIYLMTKTTATTAQGAREHLEGSLRRMKTDRIDLYQIHALRDPADVDERLQNGVLKVLLKAKEEGKVRHLGFTGHRNPEAHLRMLELTREEKPFAVCQMPVNAIDPHEDSFIEQVLPRLAEAQMGVVAMKALADGRFFALKRRHQRIQWKTETPIIPTELSVRDALHFAWSLPVSTLVTGAENASLLREKIAFAKTFERPFSKEEMEAVLEKTLAYVPEKVEYYKGKPTG
jgi:aryl-alcohol dehydrogenase-like predicted oxidoreductase